MPMRAGGDCWFYSRVLLVKVIVHAHFAAQVQNVVDFRLQNSRLVELCTRERHQVAPEANWPTDTVVIAPTVNDKSVA